MGLKSKMCVWMGEWVKFLFERIYMPYSMITPKENLSIQVNHPPVVWLVGWKFVWKNLHALQHGNPK